MVNVDAPLPSTRQNQIMIRVAVIGLPDLGMVLNGHPDLDVHNFPIGSAVGTTLGKVLRGVKPADVVFVVADDGGDQVADMLGALEKLPRPTIVIEGLDGKARGRFPSAATVTVPFTVNEIVKAIDQGLGPIAGGDETIESAVEVEEPEPVAEVPSVPETMPWDMTADEAPTIPDNRTAADMEGESESVWDSAFPTEDQPAWVPSAEQPPSERPSTGSVAAGVTAAPWEQPSPEVSSPAADPVVEPVQPETVSEHGAPVPDSVPWESAPAPDSVPPASPAAETPPWAESSVPSPEPAPVPVSDETPPWAEPPLPAPEPSGSPVPEYQPVFVDPAETPASNVPAQEAVFGEPGPGEVHAAPAPAQDEGSVQPPGPDANSGAPAWAAPSSQDTPPWATDVPAAPAPETSQPAAQVQPVEETPPWADSPQQPTVETPVSEPAPEPVSDAPAWAETPVPSMESPAAETPPWADSPPQEVPAVPAPSAPVASVEEDPPWATASPAAPVEDEQPAWANAPEPDLDPASTPPVDTPPEPAVGHEAPWVSAPETPAAVPGIPTGEMPWEAAPEQPAAEPAGQSPTEGNVIVPAEETPPWAEPTQTQVPDPQPVPEPAPIAEPAPTVDATLPESLAPATDDAPEWVTSSGPSVAPASEPIYEKPFAESPPWEAGSVPLSMDDMMPSRPAQAGSDLPAWAAGTSSPATPAPAPQAPVPTPDAATAPAQPVPPVDHAHPDLPTAPMPEWAASTRGPNDLAPVPVEENPTFAHSPYADQSETGRSGRLGRVVAVVAAKGGVGKSTMSLWTTEAIGAALRNQDRRVALVDGNIGQPDISKMMRLWGQTPDLGHIADGRRFTTAELHEALVEVPELNATVLFGPKQPIKVSEEAALRALSSAVRLMRREFSWVVIDAPVGTIFEDVYRDFILHEADLLLVVVNPHETTLQDTASFLSEISQPVHLGGMAYPTDRAAVVLNKSSPRSGLTVADVERRLPEYRVLGEIPEVASVLPAVNDGVYQAPTAAAQVIAEVVATMTGESVAVDPEAMQSRRKQSKEPSGGWGSKLRGMLSKG